MNKIILFFGFIFFNSISFAQLNYGFNIGTGFNKELIYNYRNQVDVSSYKVSYKAGVWANYSLFKRIGVNTELNYFCKNAKIDQFNLDYNYIENPVYLSVKIKRIGFSLGVSNNFKINANEFERYYTTSIIGGIGVDLLNHLSVKFWYNRELNSHNIILSPDDKYSPKHFHQNYMLSVYFKFK